MSEPKFVFETDEDMETFIGRPENSSGRSVREMSSYDLLDSLNIEYTRIDHPPVSTMEGCADIERAGALGTRICKNIFLCNRQETEFYLLVMPADKRFQTSVVSKQLGVSRLHFAREEFLAEFLDILPGSVSVLGLMNDSNGRVRLLIDGDIRTQEFFACHPCENTSSLKFKTVELFEKLIPAMGHKPFFLELP